MKVFCKLKHKPKQREEISVFTSGQVKPKVLVVSTEPLPSHIAGNLKTDKEVKGMLAILKTCVSYEFDAVYNNQTE